MGKKFTGGYIGSLSESQEAALQKMHEHFKDWKVKMDSWEGESAFKLDDRFMLKFLRARDFDVDKAEEMLAHHLAFREKWQPQKISHLDEDVKEGLDKGSWRMAGEDRKGHPIQLIQIENFNPKDVKNTDQYTRTITWHREATLKKMELDGWKVETSVVIFDMNGWGLFTHGTSHGMSLTKILIDMAQHQYPENLETAIVFNAPFVFRTAWAIIRPWLDPATASRVLFVTDPKVLHEKIDPAVLYEKYGGTRKEEYPVVPSFIGGQ